jgi:hypothetical protein
MKRGMERLPTLRASTLAFAAALSLTACSQSGDAASDVDAGEGTIDVHLAMKEGVDVKGDVLWEISNLAIDDQGGIDASAMSDENWARLADAADALAAEADLIAAAKRYVVAPDGAPLLDEGKPGGVTKQQVRAHIAKDPAGFAVMAQSLVDHARATAAAARAKDAKKAGQQVIELDHVCEGCHLEFWYPEMREFSPYQKALPKGT